MIFSTTLFEYLGMWRVAKGGLGLTVHGAHGQALPGKGHAALDSVSLFDTTRAPRSWPFTDSIFLTYPCDSM